MRLRNGDSCKRLVRTRHDEQGGVTTPTGPVHPLVGFATATREIVIRTVCAPCLNLSSCTESLTTAPNLTSFALTAAELVFTPAASAVVVINRRGLPRIAGILTGESSGNLALNAA